MPAKNYSYKSLLGSDLYEEIRRSLAMLRKYDVADHEVESYYDQRHLELEQTYGHISLEVFKELCEFSSKFKAYYDTWVQDEHCTYGPLDSIGRRMYAILDMHYDGHPVPQLMLDEAKRYKIEHEDEKEFLTSLLSSHSMSTEDIRKMYGEYKNHHRENYPAKKDMMTIIEFREKLEQYKY